MNEIFRRKWRKIGTSWIVTWFLVYQSKSVGIGQDINTQWWEWSTTAIILCCIAYMPWMRPWLHPTSRSVQIYNFFIALTIRIRVLVFIANFVFIFSVVIYALLSGMAIAPPLLFRAVNTPTTLSVADLTREVICEAPSVRLKDAGATFVNGGGCCNNWLDILSK